MRDDDGIYVMPDDGRVVMVLTKAVRHEGHVELVGTVRAGDAQPGLPAKVRVNPKDLPKTGKDWPERWEAGGLSIPIRVEAVVDGKRGVHVL